MLTADHRAWSTRSTKSGARTRSRSRASSTSTTAPQLTEEVELAVWSTVGAFVLDLSGVTFLDSSGLHALLRARAFLAREDRPLVLVCPPGPARRVLDLASVLDTFVVYATARPPRPPSCPLDE